MARESAFDYDIFISYAHDDNQARPGKRGWVDQFHDALESWLVHRRGLSELRIWRDRELDGNTKFDTAIENKITSSVLFFALHSRNYIKSDYCRRELKRFHEFNSSIPGGISIGERSRTFNILLNHFPHERWPKELQKTSGFIMHDAEGQELGEFTSPNDENFEKQLRKIVDAVEATLHEFKLSHQLSLQTTDSTDEDIRVFIADVADTLQTKRDRLISDMREYGAVAVDDIPPPFEIETHKEMVKKALTQAKLFIHLFDQFAGRRITDRKDKTYPREQFELALDSKIPQLIWIPRGLEFSKIEDEKQAAFLDTLENGSRETKNFDLVHGSFQEFSEQVLQTFNALKTHRKFVEEAHSYLIDTHQKDQRHAYKLADILVENGLDVDFNKESCDPVKSLSFFEQSVSQAKNLIIMFGKVGAAWLSCRLKKTLKITVEQFERDASTRLENIWIYLLPDGKGKILQPQLPALIHIEILDNTHSETIDPNVISPLLR